jgi:hypothetical protein
MNPAVALPPPARRLSDLLSSGLRPAAKAKRQRWISREPTKIEAGCAHPGRETWLHSISSS